MRRISNHFRDPINLILAIMVALSLLGAWFYGKQTPGLDYYVAWVAADAVKNETTTNIYDPSSRYKLAVLYRNKADEAKDAPRQKEMARHRRTLPMTATPFLYWVTGLVAVGDYETDLDNWHAISLFTLVISILFMCRLLGFSIATSLAFLMPVLVWFSPHLFELREGNVNSVQVGMVALLLWLQNLRPDKRNLFITGLGVGLLVMFKPNLAPIALLLGGGWLLRRQYVRLGVGLSGMATGAATAVLVSSWWLGSATAWFDWFRYIKGTVSHFGRTGKSYAVLTNVSEVNSLEGQVGLAAILSLLCLVFLWWGRWREQVSTGRAPGEEREKLENTLLIAMGCIVMLLASSLVWRHYYLLTIPMFIIAFSPLKEPGRVKILPLLMLRVLPAIALLSLLDSPVIRLLGIDDKAYWAVAGMYCALTLFVIGLWQFGFRIKATQTE